MSYSEQFVDAKLKIERANKHVSDLKETILGLPERFTRSVEPDSQGTGTTVKHEFPDSETFRKNISLIAGDALHNLRGALDYAWLGALLRCGIPIPTKPKFPISRSTHDLANFLKNAKVFEGAPLFNCLMHDIKSYETGNKVLYALNRLNNDDKHRMLPLSVSYVQIDGISVADKATGKLTTEQSWPLQREGPYFFDFGNQFEIKDAGKLSISILLSDAKPFHTIGIEKVLVQFSGEVSGVVRTLESVR